MPTPERTFEYLLNAMEGAAGEENPAQHGYAAKRKAVFAYVADLEAKVRALPSSGALPSGTVSERGARYEKLKAAFVGADFAYPQFEGQVCLIFALPSRTRVSCDLDATLDGSGSVPGALAEGNDQ